MRTVERAVEWLRPLVDSKVWDYCVVWKIGDDPERFLQCLGCCCSGGVDGDNRKSHVLIKKEQICRDTYFQHPIRTKACVALSNLPSSMGLYSGVHGEVMVSNQPRWIVHDYSDPKTSHHLSGTQVLIPVLGGLIELFAAKNIPQDQNIINLISSEFVGVQFLTLFPPAQNPPPPSSYTNFVSSSAVPSPSLNSNSTCIEHLPSKSLRSKKLAMERKRRSRMKDGMLALRALVPRITKRNKISVIGDAIDYIVELKSEVRRLEEELKKLEPEEEDLRKKVVCGETVHNLTTQKPLEAQVEVTQIGERHFLIKSLSEQRRGGFARLVEAMCSLGLQVVDANVATLDDGKVLNILRVEANTDISPEKLRDFLIWLADRAQWTAIHKAKCF